MFETGTSKTLDGAERQTAPSRGSSVLQYILFALAVVYVAASLYFMYSLKTRLDTLDQKQIALNDAQQQLLARLHSTSNEFKQALTSEVGLTKQQLAKRAADLERAQKQAEAKLTSAQKQQGQQLAAVNTEVSGVKTELGGAKSDIQKTQADIEATNQKLEKTIGDLGVQSGLIAHNADELEMLKRKGERNYYDFTLKKGVRTPVSTISLQLKKTNPKKSRFTLNVIADDKTIEKKDRTTGEPLQFYTGRDRLLYEIVVFSETKNSITGYLSTPKSAPAPVTP
jgi:seryl-tRNA synthetase